VFILDAASTDSPFEADVSGGGFDPASQGIVAGLCRCDGNA
jgi:hypothetical protein